MRICRTLDNRTCLIEGNEIVDVTGALRALPSCSYPFPRHDKLIADLDRLRPLFNEQLRTGARSNLDGLALTAPVANPGKIVAAPVNYRKHLEEARSDIGISFGNQVAEIKQVGLFLKATSSVVGVSEGIMLRHADRRTDHEIELAVVIGTEADRVHRDDALQHVAGYCIGLDITLRGPEERSLRKSVDTYTVLGPWLVTADEIGDPSELELSLLVNGKQRQKASTAHLIMPIPELIEFASSYYTLFPGDVLLTGTPEGVGPVVAGDVISASISRIGTMTVGVGTA